MIPIPVIATIERTNGLWFMGDYFDSDVKAFPEIIHAGTLSALIKLHGTWNGEL
jgi:hypothetical protein